MDIFVTALIVAALGGAFSAVLGWLSDEEPFIPKKFILGVIRGAVGGITIAVSFELDGSVKNMTMLFLSAMGVDVALYKGYKIFQQNKQS